MPKNFRLIPKYVFKSKIFHTDMYLSFVICRKYFMMCMEPMMINLNENYLIA